MKRILCILIFLISAVFMSDYAMAASGISIDFENVPLGSVLRVLSNKTGRKFITDTELSAKKIVLHLKDVTPDEAVNALLDTYDLYYVRQRDTDIFVIKSKTGDSITTVSKIFYCSYASASELGPVLEKKINKGGDIQADPRTNSLIVTDMADNIEKIAMLIAELDTPTPQVLLEVRLVDIKISKEFSMGLNIDLDNNDGTVYSQPYKPAGTGATITTNIIEQGIDVDAILASIMSKTDAEVLTNPKVLVLNNKTASIDIVDEIPYQQLSQTSEGGQMTSTSFKQVGVSLDVTALINNDGSVIITILPEQSFSTGESVDGVPVINTSKLSTTFRLRTGETAVIGGLIRETISDSEHKIPVLGDIPVVGYLFKRVSKEKTRKELTIFVSATVLK